MSDSNPNDRTRAARHYRVGVVFAWITGLLGIGALMGLVTHGASSGGAAYTAAYIIGGVVLVVVCVMLCIWLAAQSAPLSKK